MPARLAGSVLSLCCGLIAQDVGGCGGRVAPSPGLAGVSLAGEQGSCVQKFAGSAKAGGAGSRRLGDLVEAILLGVGSVQELVLSLMRSFSSSPASWSRPATAAFAFSR